MYSYVKDKQFVKCMRQLCGNILQECCHILKKDYDIGANFHLVGSGGKNLITQNENYPVDLDYNLEIVRCEDFNDCRTIKENVRKAFNSALHKFHWRDCQDSTSCLTTEKRYFPKINPTSFSMDVCIICRDTGNNYYRLIHEKTGYTCRDAYFWNMAPQSEQLKKKVNYIKQKSKWVCVRTQYINLKNKYLQQNDYTHPSFICYIEAVNNVYYSLNH